MLGNGLIQDDVEQYEFTKKAKFREKQKKTIEDQTARGLYLLKQTKYTKKIESHTLFN
jgi:hypothetical protein